MNRHDHEFVLMSMGTRIIWRDIHARATTGKQAIRSIATQMSSVLIIPESGARCTNSMGAAVLFERRGVRPLSKCTEPNSFKPQDLEPLICLTSGLSG